MKYLLLNILLTLGVWTSLEACRVEFQRFQDSGQACLVAESMDDGEVVLPDLLLIIAFQEPRLPLQRVSFPRNVCLPFQGASRLVPVERGPPFSMPFAQFHT